MSEELLVGHILRKYNPNEWAGTETAVFELITQLKSHCTSKIFYPRLKVNLTQGPFETLGVPVAPFHAFLPILGLKPESREQLTQIGGNLMSFDLIKQLWSEKGLSLIHMHTLGLLGGIGRTIAKQRGIPLVVSLHGNVFDVPKSFVDEYKKKVQGSLSYTRLFSPLLKPDRVLAEADAVITFNTKERDLLVEKYPGKNIVHIPHGIDTRVYQQDYRELAYDKNPWIKGKTFCLVVGRIDSVKNQGWLIDQVPRLLQKIPDLVVGFLGPVTDAAYDRLLKKKISDLGLSQQVRYLGNLPPKDRLLIGLYQIASFTVLPSIAEPFGLVILESWASKTPVLASSVSGPIDIIEDRKTGWLFDLDKPNTFHHAVMEVVENPMMKNKIVENSQQVLEQKYDLKIMGEKTRLIYQSLTLKVSC